MLSRDDIEGGKHARLVRKGNDARIIGHGKSTHYRATVDGETVRIPWNATLQVSTSVDKPGDGSPNVPLLDIDIARELAANNQLEQVS